MYKKWFFLAALLFITQFAFADGNAWDSLRPLSDLASGIDVPVKIVVFLLAFSIFLIASLAYSKSKSKRILLVAVAFFLFSAKWFVKLIDIFYSPGSFLSDSSENIFELGIMVSLLVALFYKKSWKNFFSREKD